jgi:tetratricopeptide (TPR) repeat protein
LRFTEGASAAVLQRWRRIQFSAGAQQMLGSVYLGQCRYEEALEAFNASLRDCPDRRSVPRDIAEVWLRQNNAEEALNWAVQAVDTDRAAGVASGEIHEMNLAEDLATLAWALASARKDRSQVEDAAAESERLAQNKPVTTLAQVHLHLGYAYAALDDTGRSLKHLDLVVRSDAQGISGRDARRFVALAGR